MSRLEGPALRAAQDLRVNQLDQAGNVVNHRGIDAVSPPRVPAIIDQGELRWLLHSIVASSL
eukprot:8600174-Pyramimonas_sp.AAC.1